MENYGGLNVGASRWLNLMKPWKLKDEMSGPFLEWLKNTWSTEKKLGWLGCHIGDYVTTQLYRDCNRPL